MLSCLVLNWFEDTWFNVANWERLSCCGLWGQSCLEQNRRARWHKVLTCYRRSRIALRCVEPSISGNTTTNKETRDWRWADMAASKSLIWRQNPNGYVATRKDILPGRREELQLHIITSPSSYSSLSRVNTSGDSSYSRADRLTPRSTAASHSASSVPVTKLRTDEEDAASKLLSLGYLPAQNSQLQILHNTSQVPSQSSGMSRLPTSGIGPDLHEAELFD